MAAAALGFVLERNLSATEIAAWGWRVPFAVGCWIVPVIYIVRRRLDETEAFARRSEHPDLWTVLSVLAANARAVLLGMMLVVMTTVAFYLVTIYTPTFGRQVLHLGTSDTLIVTFAVGLSNFIWLPTMGGLSDRLGRKPILIAFSILMIVSVYPALSWLAAARSFAKMLGAELWLSFLYASYNGAMVVTLTEIVPADARTSGFLLAYSLATATFGGFTPAISEELIKVTADKAAPGLWVTASAAISLMAALLIDRTDDRHETASQ